MWKENIQVNSELIEDMKNDFKFKFYTVVGIFLFMAIIQSILVNIFCGVSFCGGMLIGITLPIAFISMVVYLLIWKKNIWIEQKNSTLVALEKISLVIFILSLFIGFIFSFM